MSVDYGKSIKITDEGLVGFKNGDLQFIDGPENVAQRIIIATTTHFGEDIFNPDYGLDHFLIFGSDVGLDDQIDIFKMQLKKTILDDDQVEDAPEITYEVVDYVNRQYDFTITVALVGGESYTANVGGINI